MQVNPERRNFIKLLLAGTLGSKFLFSNSVTAKEATRVESSKLKLSAQIRNPFLDEDLKFVKQLGLNS
ncbi:MAG: hypothetical protein KAR19_14525 [Bacteroidales bacterium]|nr:hypothetical protein [Bacteroidales bacterium]